jgi:hypothetical protein
MKQQDVFSVTVPADDNADVVTLPVFQSDAAAKMRLPIGEFRTAAERYETRTFLCFLLRTIFFHLLIFFQSVEALDRVVERLPFSGLGRRVLVFA